jgi:hypothetical protein
MADELVRQAVAQAKVGNKTEARKLATRAIKADPNNVSAWVVMAQVVGDKAKAIDCLQTVLQLEPGHPWATLHLNRLKYGDAPAQPVSSALSRGEARPAAMPAEEPEDESEPDLMRDLRERAPSTFDMRVEDLGDYVRPIDTRTDVQITSASLDPLAGTDDWQRPLTDTSRDFSYDEIKDVIGVDTGKIRENQQGKPRRRVAPLMILFVVVFVVMALLAMAIGAWTMNMIPGIPGPGG